MMAINLYTSRVVLSTLGVSDYGIYNVVGGIVAMFVLLSGSITNAITRFITFELGRKDFCQLQKVFSTSLNVMFVLSIVIITLGEIIGIWFLNYRMNIPEGRLIAANWVFQCSLLTFVINLISIPYNSTIVAHERMSAFAYISIFEACMKLFIVYSLYISPFDKLKTYAVLLLLLSGIIRFVYGYYCKKHFSESVYRLVYDKTLLKKMLSFAGWNFFGQGAGLINNQGINILMNIFFGVSVNAARGIAMQVNAAVSMFVTNFMMALNPQITKMYASGNIEEMHKLIYRGVRFSYYLMLFLLIPICLETNMLLEIWLGNIPEYSVSFVQWTLIITMINMLSNTLVTALHANGNIKRYMIIVGTVEMMNFPITYILFKHGFGVLMAYYIYFIISIILMLLRLLLIKKMIFMNAITYVKEVYLRIFLVTACALVFPLVIFYNMSDTFIRFITICVISCFSTVSSIYFVGLKNKERAKLRSLIKIRLSKY